MAQPPPPKKKMDQNFLGCQFVVDPPKHTQTLSEVVASTGSIFIAILKSLLIVLRCLGLRIFLMDQFFCDSILLWTLQNAHKTLSEVTASIGSIFIAILNRSL